MTAKEASDKLMNVYSALGMLRTQAISMHFREAVFLAICCQRGLVAAITEDGAKKLKALGDALGVDLNLDWPTTQATPETIAEKANKPIVVPVDPTSRHPFAALEPLAPLCRVCGRKEKDSIHIADWEDQG